MLFRFDSHLLAEQFKESEQLIYAPTKFINSRKVSDKTTNQRLTRKRTLNENNDVEVIINPVASSAEPSDSANLFHVSQYSDLPMNSANLSLLSVLTSGNQCIINRDTDPIFSSVTLEAHNQIHSPNVKALKNTTKIKRSISYKKKGYTEPSGSISSGKNNTMALPNKNSA